MANKLNYDGKAILNIKFSPKEKGYDPDEVDRIFDNIISDYDIYRGIGPESIETGLDIASAGNHYSIRIGISCLVQHLPALMICYIRDRAGIYDIFIRLGVKWHNNITIFLQNLLDSFSLICIYLATETAQCYSFHLWNAYFCRVLH